MYPHDRAAGHGPEIQPTRDAPGFRATGADAGCFAAPGGDAGYFAAPAHGGPGSGAAARSKLRAALAWLRARDPWIAERIERVECRLGPGVGAATPCSDGTLLLNPAALRDLSAEEVAGLLVSSALAVPELARLDAAELAELAARVGSPGPGEARAD